MMIQGSIDAALAGIRQNLDRLDRAAHRIAVDAPGGDLEGDLVDLLVSRRGAEANMATLRVADEMVGTLLDLLA